MKNDCRNAKLHFQMTFSLPLTLCLLKLPNIKHTLRHSYSPESHCVSSMRVLISGSLLLPYNLLLVQQKSHFEEVNEGGDVVGLRDKQREDCSND